MEQGFKVTIVIPVYNEQAILEDNLIKLSNHFDRIVGKGKWLAYVVDNNSVDETALIIDAIADRNPNIHRLYQGFPDVGQAVAMGLGKVETPWAYVLSIDEWDVPFIAWAWINRRNYDLFIGTKRADPSINRQSVYRKFLSWGLNTLLRALFNFSGTDTHGPKMICMEPLQPILDTCVMRRGQYDTEFVLKSQRGGLRVVEVPVAFEEQRPPRDLMIKKISRNVRDLIKLRRAMNAFPGEEPPNLSRFSRGDVLKAVEKQLGP